MALDSKKYSDVLIDNIKMPVVDLMNEMFTKDRFKLPHDYNIKNFNHFKDLKSILLKEFPVLQQNLKYFKHLQNTIENFNKKIIYMRDFHYPKIFNIFMKTLQQKIVKFYEDFYKMALEDSKKNNENNVSNIPKDLNFLSLRKNIKDHILKISNELFSMFSERPQIVYEEEFTSLCEKIIRLNEYLIHNESSVIGKSKIHYGTFLLSICSSKIHQLSSYLRIDHEKVSIFLNDVNYYPRNYPIHMSRTRYIMESLHNIIRDDFQNDYSSPPPFDIEGVAKAVFQRDRKKLEKDLPDMVRKYVDSEDIKDNTEDFERNIDFLTKDMQKLRSEGDILEKNPVYEGIIDSSLDVKFIEFMEQTEENEEILMNIERLACDYFHYMKNSKDLFERMMFFTKEEELFYRNKYFQVINNTIHDYEKEVSANNMELFIKNLFEKLQKLIIKEREAIPENEIEGRLLMELEKNEDNPYLGGIFRDLQHSEKQKEIYSMFLRDKNKKTVMNLKVNEKDLVNLKLVKETSDFVYKKSKNSGVSPLAKSRSLQIKTDNLDKLDFSQPSPINIKKPSVFNKKGKDVINLIPSQSDLRPQKGKMVSIPSDEEDDSKSKLKKKMKLAQQEPSSFVDLDSKLSSNRSKKDRVTFEEFDKLNSGRSNNDRTNPLVDNKKPSLKNIKNNLKEEMKEKEKSPPSSKRLKHIKEDVSDEDNPSRFKPGKKAKEYSDDDKKKKKKEKKSSDESDDEGLKKKKKKDKKDKKKSDDESFDKKSDKKKKKKEKKRSSDEDSDHKKNKKKKDKKHSNEDSDEDSMRKKTDKFNIKMDKSKKLDDDEIDFMGKSKNRGFNKESEVEDTWGKSLDKKIKNFGDDDEGELSKPFSKYLHKILHLKFFKF